MIGDIRQEDGVSYLGHQFIGKSHILPEPCVHELHAGLAQHVHINQEITYCYLELVNMLIGKLGQQSFSLQVQ